MDRRNFVTGTGAIVTALLAGRRDVAAAAGRIATAGSPADEYLLEPGLLYLNHGSIGTIPRAVLDAYTGLLRACESNPHTHMWEDVWTDEVARTRTLAATLLNARESEVALTHNTTEAFNILAHGLPLGAGDEVLFSSLNHASASEPWRHHGGLRGYSVRRFDIPFDDVPGLSVDDVVALHAREIRDNTRVLVIPHIDNLVGVAHPVAQIAAAARARGVEFVAVDIAQSLGMIPVDFAAWDVDFIGASPHKWVQAPKGSGLLVVRDAARARLEPLWVKRQRAQMPDTAEIFEDYSTRNLAAVVALGHAIAFQNALPAGAAERRLRLARHFRTRVDATPGLAWRSPRNDALLSSLFGVGFTTADARTVERGLRERGIVVRAFGPPLNALRVSPNLTHDEGSAERFFSAVADTLRG